MLTELLAGRTLLLAVAAPVEVRGVFAGLERPDMPVPSLWGVARVHEKTHVLYTGVSKANAAGALGCVLGGTHPYGAVLSVGIAGALPGPNALRVGQSVVATACVFADEGVVTSGGFQTIESMGFPLDPSLDSGGALPTDPSLQQLFRSVIDVAGPVATVSTCSGTDSLAREVRERTGAIAETMEGAALALVARRRGVRFCEVRTISNLTGERSAQAWDIPGAVGRLSDIVRAVVA